MLPDPRFAADFRRLVRKEGLDDLDALMTVKSYQALPLFSRSSHISFLDGLSTAEKNVVLIRAGAWYLTVVMQHAFSLAAEPDLYCALSVHDRIAYEDGDLLDIRFFLTNPSKGHLDLSLLASPDSGFARYVGDCLDNNPAFVVKEGQTWAGHVDVTWLADEHVRYSRYLDALAAGHDLVDAVLADPDRAMAEATIVKEMDRRAALSPLALDNLADDFPDHPFLSRRLAEWRLFFALDRSTVGLLEASDWLQRMAVAKTGSTAALELLAEHGRTRRIRADALRRLARTG
jgi:hypothetical protein